MSKKEKNSSKAGGRAGKVLKITAIVLCMLLIVPLLAVEAGRLITLAGNRITSKNGVDESIFVELCGQRQRLLIRGEDVSNPVVIWLHGGPGGPDTYVNYWFQKYLVDKYTFINWDQRGCGSTYYKNLKNDPDNSTVTFEQALDDLDALVDYARERFGAEKVIIAGHSYGTVLGSRYIARHPEKIAAYVGTGQAVWFNEKTSTAHALLEAGKKGDDTSAMMAAFKAYSEDKNYEHLAALRKETGKYSKAEREANTITIGMFSPYMKLNDLRWFLKPMIEGEAEFVKINQQLLDVCFDYNAPEYGTEYAVPMNFISGSCDWICAVTDSEEFCETVTAPYKSWHELEGCGHTPQFDAPEEYAKIFDSVVSESLAAK